MGKVIWGGGGGEGWSRVSNVVEAEDSEDFRKIMRISIRRLLMNCVRQKPLWAECGSFIILSS